MRTPIRIYCLALSAAAIWAAAIFWLMGALPLAEELAAIIFVLAVLVLSTLAVHWLPCPPDGNAFAWVWRRFRTSFLVSCRRYVWRVFRRYGDSLLVALFVSGLVILVIARWLQPDPLYESLIGLAGILLGLAVSVWVRVLRCREAGLLALGSLLIYVFPGWLGNYCKASVPYASPLCGGIEGLQDWSNFYLGIGLALVSGTLPQLWPQRRRRRRLLL